MSNAGMPLPALEGIMTRPEPFDPYTYSNFIADNRIKQAQAQQAQMSVQAKRKAGQIIATSPDMDSATKALEADPLVAGFAPEAMNNLAGYMQTLTQRAGEQQTQGTDAFQTLVGAMPQVYMAPEKWDSIMQSRLQGMPQAMRTQMAPAIESMKESLLGGMDLKSSDPQVQAQNKVTFANRIMGLMTAHGVTPEGLSNIIGRGYTQDLGPGVQSGVEVPAYLGGGQRPATFVPKGTAPAVSIQPVGPGGEQTPVYLPGKFPSEGGSSQPIGGALGINYPASGQGNAGGNALAPAAAPQNGVTLGPSMGPSLDKQTYLADTGKAVEEYQNTLNTRVRTGTTIMQTLAEARGALAKFKPGAGAEVYKNLGQMAQMFGMDQATVDAINGGDLGASQEFEKLMVNTTMGQIQNQLHGVGASRLSQMEFQTFNNSNPNLKTDPRAIEKIFNFWTRLYNYDRTEQKTMTDYVNQGEDLKSWPTYWATQAVKTGLIHASEAPLVGQPGDPNWNPSSPPPGHTTHKKSLDEWFGAH